MLALQILPETIRFREPFRIAGYVFDIAEIVTVRRRRRGGALAPLLAYTVIYTGKLHHNRGR